MITPTRRTRPLAIVLLLSLVAGSAAGQRAWNQHRPFWSPDGAAIVFMSDRTFDWELYSITLDGADLRRLTGHVGWDG